MWLLPEISLLFFSMILVNSQKVQSYFTPAAHTSSTATVSRENCLVKINIKKVGSTKTYSKYTLHFLHPRYDSPVTNVLIFLRKKGWGLLCNDFKAWERMLILYSQMIARCGLLEAGKIYLFAQALGYDRSEPYKCKSKLESFVRCCEAIVGLISHIYSVFYWMPSVSCLGLSYIKVF